MHPRCTVQLAAGNRTGSGEGIVRSATRYVPHTNLTITRVCRMRHQDRRQGEKKLSKYFVLFCFVLEECGQACVTVECFSGHKVASCAIQLSEWGRQIICCGNVSNKNVDLCLLKANFNEYPLSPPETQVYRTYAERTRGYITKRLV